MLSMISGDLRLSWQVNLARILTDACAAARRPAGAPARRASDLVRGARTARRRRRRAAPSAGRRARRPRRDQAAERPGVRRRVVRRAARGRDRRPAEPAARAARGRASTAGRVGLPPGRSTSRPSSTTTPDALPAVARRGDDPAVILFTSGTSGRAEGRHADARRDPCGGAYAAEALRLGPDDVMLGAAPFSHVLGQSTGLVSTFMAGAAVAVVPASRGGDAAADDRRRGRRSCSASRRCASRSARPHDRRASCRRSGSRMSAAPPSRVEVARDFERTFGGEVYEGYGLTEMSGDRDDLQSRPGAKARLGRDAARRDRAPDRLARRDPLAPARSARSSSAGPR